jgi:hypothetical protein
MPGRPTQGPPRQGHRTVRISSRTLEVLHVFDHCALIFVTHVVAVVVALVLDEVRAGAQDGRLPFRVVDDAQLAEFRFRPAVQHSINIGQQNGFHVLRMHIRYEANRRPLGPAQQIGVEVELGELRIERLQEREKARKSTVLRRDFNGAETLAADLVRPT